MLRRCIFLGLSAMAATVAVVCTGQQTAAQQASPQPEATPTVVVPSAPVAFAGRTLFVLHARIGSFSPEDRARALTERLEKLAAEGHTPPAAIRVTEMARTSDIAASDLMLVSVTDADASAAGMARAQLAAQWLAAIRSALAAYTDEHSSATTLQALLYTALATAALLLLLALAHRGFRRLRTTVDSWRTTRIKPIRIQRLEVVSADRVATFLLLVVRTAQLVIWLILLTIYAPLVFSFFPVTRRLVEGMADGAMSALRTVGGAILGYLPSVAFLVVVAAIAWVAIRFVRVVFSAIESRTIVLPGFYPDWAQPTYKIVRFVIIVIAAIAMFPYVPGSGSTAFRGISFFIGAILSLGSTSAVSNVIAGVVLTYTRAFQLGDRVQIGDAVGDVVARTLLVTRIRTIKNVEVTIPNSQVLSRDVSNFTSRARHGGVILHTTVTIGYDAPWRKVHELLVRAARATPGLLADPTPFVLQTSLDDSYVSYQINATTDQPARMAEIYSALHQNIQDAFNEAGIEIMSPHYRALRDGNRVTIPRDYLPPEYREGAFRVQAQAAPTPTPPEEER
jgi:small-conductance mechanosensitive channel